MKYRHSGLSLFCFMILYFIGGKMQAQPSCYFEHYGAEDGLPQHTITDILQDEKGFMWFSTWDGLCKFDGYKFSTYRLPVNSAYQTRSNRIDFIYEDKYGNIWSLSYDSEAHRFNPRTEKFAGIRALAYSDDKTFDTSQIIPMESGKVWLLSEKNGCICITDSTFSAEIYNTDNQNLSGNTVYTVFEDTSVNSWILTNNGLLFVPADAGEPTSYFNERSEAGYRENRPFYSVMETDNDIWFGSDNGEIQLFDKNNRSFRTLKTETASSVISIKEISLEKILVVTRNNGFLIYNTYDGNWNRYNSTTLAGMQSDKILTDYIDRSKNIWLETECIGISKFNPYTEKFVHFTPLVESTEPSVFPPNFFIFEDVENRVWVHPRGGGFSLYDKSEDQLTPFYNRPFSDNWMFSNMLHAGYSDRQGNLWICTRSHGLEKIIFHDSHFTPFLIDDNIHSTVSNDVRPIFEDADKNLWISTKEGRIYVYNRFFEKIGYLCNDGSIGKGIPLQGIAYNIIQDSQQCIWIGTKGEGVYKLKKHAAFAYRMTQYKHDPADSHSLSHNSVYTIFEDKHKRIWVGTYGGGLNLLNGDSFIHYNNTLKNYSQSSGSQVRIISADKHGNICVGTTLGLIMFTPDFDNPADILFKPYLREESAQTINSNDIFDICTTRNGDTYIGTFGGGISKVEETDANGFPVKFKSYSTHDGLPSNITLSIQEDDNENLWISSEGSLTKFNPEKETFENFSQIKRLMKRQNFSENSRWKTYDGKILFGHSNGIIIFDPKEVKNNTFNPRIALVQFKIFNREISIGKKSPLKEHIDDIGKLTLKYNQNFFSVDFAALDYVDPNNISYAYKLDGFDKDWIYSRNQRSANYTNLSKGKYVFRVKSTNSDGVWMNNERTLAIEVLPPFWATWWAYCIYVILFLSVAYFTFRILYTFYRMRNRIVLEKRESEIKTRFFTDISHEIRTPLTMIVSPIENILQDNTISESVKKQLTLVSKNTSRLLNMVNQILDFQKLQQKTLNVRNIEMGVLVQGIASEFAKTAEEQHIRFTIENKIGNQTVWVDPQAVEKIVVNLLSNAFKYTPAGKSIQISVLNKNGYIAVQVADDGIGITKDKQERLFKRFESFNEDKSKPSTGIGLSIVKELADKHHAKITVDSETEKGSVFTVLFQKGMDHFGADTVIHSGENATSGEAENTAKEITPAIRQETTKRNTKPTILIVEDDDDLRAFIHSILENDYKVYEASNGKDGMESALEIIPDFIVSDIMMPEMDGIDFLRNVRAHIRTSHTLFLLLTAKTTLDSKLEGFEHGADEYITKPFSVSYFRARVKNLLYRREQLQQYYRSNTETADNEGAIHIRHLINEQDTQFIQTVNAFIEKNIDNSDFVVEDLAVELGMSRTVFFKKMKGLTGLSPIEYIRDRTLQHAAKLLQTGTYNVKEVSYMVGFSDTKYFTRCFKGKYGITPGEYKKASINEIYS